jgi:hypothetical protein
MSDLVRRPSQFADLPRVLRERSADFAGSPEAALVAQDFDLPTVVADAFGEYVLRMAALDERSRELDAALAAVEWMAASEDEEIQNCAVIGVLSRVRELGPRTERSCRSLALPPVRPTTAGAGCTSSRCCFPCESGRVPPDTAPAASLHPLHPNGNEPGGYLGGSDSAKSTQRSIHIWSDSSSAMPSGSTWT